MAESFNQIKPPAEGLNKIQPPASAPISAPTTPQPVSAPAPSTTQNFNQIEAPMSNGEWIVSGERKGKQATTPAPSTTQPAPGSTSAPSASATGTSSGINEAEMLRLGVSQDQIDRAKQIYNPLLQAGEASKDRGEDLYKKTTEQLTAEQSELEKFSQSIADRKTNLTNESLGLVEESAELQKARAKEEYQANQFRNEQAKKDFELSQGRAERELELSNIENETRLRRAMGAQVGAAYGSQGLEMMGRLFLDANSTLADLRTKTSIGMAEFSFKAMDIESNYTLSVNEIINNSKAEKLALKANLDDDLDAIDSQILSSKEEKQALAREALKEYYNKVDTIEMQNADLISTANKDLFTEKKELEQEKLEKETFDPSMSESLGFYANRYGQPIGVTEGGTPKPYTGGWDEALSQQFGHLVDGKGRPVIGSDGSKIPYKDLSAVAYQNSLSAYSSGDYNVGDLGNLNFSMGVNNVISATLENGKVYPSPKYGKLQCGEYINDQFLASRQLGSDFANADALIKSHGGKPGNFKPQIGDVVFMNTGDPKIPHKAIVEGISESGKLILTDANYTAPGQVRHGWEVAMDDKKLYGYARLPLKANVAAATPAMTETSGTDGGPAVFKLLDQQFGSIKEYEAMQGTEGGREMLREMRTEFGTETVEAWLASKRESASSGKAGAAARDNMDINWAETVIGNRFATSRAGVADAKKDEFYRLLDEGKGNQAASIAMSSLFPDNKSKDDMFEAKSLQRNYGEVKSALDELEKVAKAQNIDTTGPWDGRLTTILGKVGKSNPAEFTRLQARLGKAFAAYGKSISGAAMSDAERDRLMEQFGSIEKAPFNNRVLIEELIRDAGSQLDQKVYSLTNGLFSSGEELDQAMSTIENYGKAPSSGSMSEAFSPFIETGKSLLDFGKRAASSSPSSSLDFGKYLN